MTAPGRPALSIRSDTRRIAQLPAKWGAARIATRVAVLDNGLTVIAHRDRKAPIVAAYVIYRAGSREEPDGKRGLAHLFEHLMYAGTRRFPGNTFRHLEKIGATSINAVSREDYAAYFATVPKRALDQALAIEAARMEAATFTQDDFARQREVVRNELIERESAAYGSINRIIAQQAYPRTHPYSHPADGTIAELDQIAFADAIAWQRAHYRPANAAVVIAGDIAPAEAIARARTHFGMISSANEARVRLDVGISKQAPKRIVVADHASASRVYLVWNTPPFASPEYRGLELLVEIIGGGPESLLSRYLVGARRLAIATGGELRPREWGSQLVLWATARESVALSKLEKALCAAIQQLIDLPPTRAAIDQARSRRYAQLLRDTERLCGPRSKAELLGAAWIMAGDPNAHQPRLTSIASLRPHELRELAQALLDQNPLVIHVRAATSSLGRKRQKTPVQRPPARRRIIVPRSPRRSAALIPTVAIRHGGPAFCEIRVVIEGGAREDPVGRSGLAGVAVATLTDTMRRHGSLTIGAHLDRLGALIESRVHTDVSVIRLSAAATSIYKALDHFIDLIDRSFIDEAAIERAKGSRLAAIRAEESQPLDYAMRLLPTILYGYARPPSGRAAEVAQLTGEEVGAILTRWRTASAVRVIVAGPSVRKTLATLGARTGACFAVDGKGSTAQTALRQRPFTHSRVILINVPGRSQSAIFAAHAIGPRRAPDFVAIAAADTLLGGSFASRLNMNLRERKGWCYGARTVVSTWRAAGLWTAYAFVDPARTLAAMHEIEREWRAIGTTTSSELQDATDYMTRRVAAELETTAQRASAAEDLIAHGLPRSWPRSFADRLGALRPRDIADACKAIVEDQPLVWVVLGDASLYAAPIEAAGFGAVAISDGPEAIA